MKNKKNQNLNELKKYLKIKFILEYISEWFSYYSKGLLYKIEKHRLFFYSSALSFDLILCLIPFIFLIFSYLGSLLQSQATIKQINLLIEQLIPYTTYTREIREIVFDRIAEFVEYKTLAGIIGAGGMLFTCSGLFSSMRTILNEIFDIQKEKGLLIAKLRDFGMVLLVILIFAFLVILSPSIEIIRSFLTRFDLHDYLITKMLLSGIVDLMIIFFTFSLFYFFYSVTPYEKISYKVSFVSALWATFLFEFSKMLFKFYINNFVDYNKIYGNFAFLIIIALWIYFFAIIFIISALIGQLYRERKQLLETVKRNNPTFKEFYSPMGKKIKKTYDNTIKKGLKKGLNIKK